MTSTLATADRGEVFAIESVPDTDVRAQLLRLGFLDGTVECYRRVTNGPVVLRRNGTTLALGASIADEVVIERRDAE